jgi:hypothetical protein
VTDYSSLDTHFFLLITDYCLLSALPASPPDHPNCHRAPVLQNDSVNNVAAADTPPSPKMFVGPVEFLVNHDAFTSMTPDWVIWIDFIKLQVLSS